MPNWEYKVISSGRGGFATPALLEKFLNDLGQDEWEIIEFRSSAENALAFSGLARRSTQREWTLEGAAAAAARAEADKLRAEFEAKFKGATGAGAAAASGAEEGGAAPAPVIGGPDDGLRRLRDTDSDQDPDAPTEPEDDWDKLSSEDELPTFFDAIRPLMRRNQRGPGMSVGVDQLARKWDFTEEDVKGALLECGFVVPEDEDTKPTYVEYDGDLYWVNVNRRGELWVNTREKPRPVFRTVRGAVVAPAEGEQPPVPENGGGDRPERQDRQDRDRQDRHERRERPAQEQHQPGQPLPTGAALLDRIRPQMRRNRRGPGASGSIGFLSRALRCTDADLMSGFAESGLVLPADGQDKPVFVEIGDNVWWLNKDQRGGIWINQRLKSDMREHDEAGQGGEGGQSAGDTAPAASETPGDTPSSDGAASEPSGEAEADSESGSDEEAATDGPAADAPANSTLAACRLLMKETKTGGFSATVENLASELGRPVDQLTSALVEAGLRVPEKPKEKPTFAESGGDVFWLNRNARDEIWLNAKTSKFSGGQKRGSRSRRPRKSSETPAAEAN